MRTDRSDLEIPDSLNVSILVVGFNSAALIRNCLSSVATACTRFSYEILFVDQGDGSTEALVRADFPEVRVIPSQGNLGFAGGNNLLARSAIGANLLLLNPDVELQPGAIDALLDASTRHADASAWGGVTLDRNGDPDVGNTVHVPSLREMASRLVGRSSVALGVKQTFDHDEPARVLSGGFVMIARSAWDEAGGLDQRFFLYCEEVDLFYRLHLAGHTFWRIAKARAHHDIGHGEAASPMRVVYLTTGIMQFARLHWSTPRQWAAFFLMWLGAIQRFAVGVLLSPLGRKFKALRDGNRLIATRPNYWRFGYDPKKGLLARLNHAGSKLP